MDAWGRWENVNEDLFTDDLDIASAQTRGQLAALLRTVHLRADRPSLRHLEARTRHDITPLSKTAVSEMLKGTRLPRKTVMISFLRACGVPSDVMGPWHRAWERVASSEQYLSGPAAYTYPTQKDQPLTGDVLATSFVTPGQADGQKVASPHADAPQDATSRADQSPEPVGRTPSGRRTPGPMVRRRELATLLRALRVSAGMTIDQVAERLLCSASKVSRMETGARSITLRDIRDLCDLYQVAEPQRHNLTELVRESRKQGWWQSYDLRYATFLGLEADAISIEIFHSALVPGLLQTADYARAIIEGVAPGWNTDRVEQNVAIRLTRQRILTQKNPPQLRVIIDEAALHRVIGSPAVMKDQLNRIIEISNLPHVAVQIVSYRTGAHVALDNSFTILELPHPVPSIIYVEGLFGFIYLERQQDIERYERAFRKMESTAAKGPESIELIAETKRRYE
jgi:transcriptional regulator with XRE-family HTH domain